MSLVMFDSFVVITYLDEDKHINIAIVVSTLPIDVANRDVCTCLPLYYCRLLGLPSHVLCGSFLLCCHQEGDLVQFICLGSVV